MTNAEVIKALRRCSYMTVAGADREDGYCKPCAYYAEDSADVTCIDRMMIDAADALEAAEARIAELERILKAVQKNSGINFRLWQEAEAMMQTVTECHTLEEGEQHGET